MNGCKGNVVKATRASPALHYVTQFKGKPKKAKFQYIATFSKRCEDEGMKVTGKSRLGNSRVDIKGGLAEDTRKEAALWNVMRHKFIT